MGSSEYPNVDVLVIVVLSELVDIYIETDDDYTPNSIPDVLTTFECFNTGLQSPPLTTRSRSSGGRKGNWYLKGGQLVREFFDVVVACKCSGSWRIGIYVSCHSFRRQPLRRFIGSLSTNINYIIIKRIK